MSGLLVKIDYVDYVRDQRRYERAKAGLGNINRQVIQQAGEIYRDTAEMISPKKTGQFAKSWHYRTRIRGNGLYTELDIYNTDPKASFIIEGTRPHLIYAKNAKSLRFFTKRGEKRFAKGVLHPGTEPNDIFEKVSDLADNRVSNLFEDSLRRFADLI